MTEEQENVILLSVAVGGVVTIAFFVVIVMGSRGYNERVKELYRQNMACRIAIAARGIDLDKTCGKVPGGPND
jgi:hypothetical protein